jgi:hypothetical protein
LEQAMRNPWASKNPFMSVWLSSANKVMGSARGHAAAAAKREVATLQAETAKQVLDFWSGKTLVPPPSRKKKRP